LRTAARTGAVVLGGLALRPAVAAASSSPNDVAILNFALALEYLQASFYTEAERIGALHGALAHQANVVGVHERDHVKAFKSVLGSAAIKQPSFNFHGVTENPDAFRSTAVAFEDLATAAYKEQAPKIESRTYLAAALAIHSVEARHAAWIRRLAGFLPAAKAFDEPLSNQKVVAIVNSTHFVTLQDPSMSARTSPRFTG
jgi:rubrerythrin